jgi:SAM-dependent methyltransferase
VWEPEPVRRSFEELVAEAEAEPIEGWDFSWLEGRATEDRPSWGYVRNLVSRVAKGTAVLDIQTGGGEVFAEVLAQAGAPRVVAATESWPPSVALARKRLRPYGADLVEVADEGELPFPDASFDLVVSRHPTVVVWDEIARILGRGGTYFSQQVGSGSNRELTDFMMGPQPVSDRRNPDRAATEAQRVGLEIVDLRRESLEVRFFDVGAIVYFLHKVFWTVPDFSVDRYWDRLVAMHDEIESQGSFVSHAQRFLIEVRKP